MIEVFGYWKRKRGVDMIYRTLRRLGHLNIYYMLDPEKDPHKEARDLLFDVLHKDGNFYRKGNAWPAWSKWIDGLPSRISYRLRLIWGAVIGSDDVGFVD